MSFTSPKTIWTLKPKEPYINYALADSSAFSLNSHSSSSVLDSFFKIASHMSTAWADYSNA